VGPSPRPFGLVGTNTLREVQVRAFGPVGTESRIFLSPGTIMVQADKSCGRNAKETGKSPGQNAPGRKQSVKRTQTVTKKMSLYIRIVLVGSEIPPGKNANMLGQEMPRQIDRRTARGSPP
jgi:hypothetical protein